MEKQVEQIKGGPKKRFWESEQNQNNNITNQKTIEMKTKNQNKYKPENTNANNTKSYVLYQQNIIKYKHSVLTNFKQKYK